MSDSSLYRNNVGAKSLRLRMDDEREELFEEFQVIGVDSEEDIPKSSFTDTNGRRTTINRHS